VNNSWIKDAQDEQDMFDETELLLEFEKMLNGDDNEYDRLSEEERKKKQKDCYSHYWELVGSGPVTDTPWYNCKNCGISKEEYEKK
jgi:hypothetical protein